MVEHEDMVGRAVVTAHPYACVRWSAIIGGWVVATGMASLMYAAGLALGFTAFDPYNATAAAKAVGVGTAVWVVLTWAVSLFLGGMFASWFDAKADQTVGALHGVAVWGLAVAASALLLALGVTQALQGGAAVMRGAAAVGIDGRGPMDSPDNEAITGLQAQLTQRVAHNAAKSAAGGTVGAPSMQPVPGPGTAAGPTINAPGGPQTGNQTASSDTRRATEPIDRRTMALVAGALVRGHTDNAKALLAANSSLSPAEIDQTVQDISPQVEKAKADVQAAADAAAHYTSRAMWILFLSSLIALVAAVAGGWLGAGHIHRVYHLRRYERVGSSPL